MNSTFFIPIVTTCDSLVGPVLTPGAPYEKKKKKKKKKKKNDIEPEEIAACQKLKALSLPVSEKKNFEIGLLRSYVKTCDPRRGVSFDPR